MNWATMATAIVNKHLRFENSVKVYNIYTTFKKIYVCDNILYGMVCGILGHFEGF